MMPTRNNVNPAENMASLFAFTDTLHDALLDNFTTIETPTTNSTNYDYFDYEAAKNQFSIRVRTKLSMLAVIIPLGLLFNITACVVLVLSPNLRKATTTHFLIALTFADNTYLLGELLNLLNMEDPYWGHIFGLKFTHSQNFWCRVTFFLRNFGQFSSSWLTVAVTAERCLCVSFPLKVGQFSTKFTTRVIIITIFVLSIAATAYPFWIYQVFYDVQHEYHYCIPKSEAHYYYWNTAVFRFGALVIPSILVLIFTVVILYKIRAMSKVRREMFAFREARVTTSHERDEKQLTIMLILVASAFILLRLPFSILSLIQVYQHGFNYGGNYTQELALDITYCIAAMNYGINLFLFCISGTMFRKRFLACLKCEKITLAISTKRHSNPTTMSNISRSSTTRKNTTTNAVNLNEIKLTTV